MERDKNALRKRARLTAGKAINRIGHLCLPLGVGIVFGFYLADRETPFLPTLASVVLFVFILGFIAVPLGRILQGAAFEDTPDRRKIRKRVIVFTALAALAVLARLLVFWMEQPSPLTSLSAAEFNAAFELDAKRYSELDSGMEAALAFLEAPSTLFDGEDEVLSADEERKILATWWLLYDQAFALDQIRAHYEDWFRFDPSRAGRSFHLRSFLLAFAAESALYEKATRAVRRIGDNPNVAKFLDSPHPRANMGKSTFSVFRQELQGSRDRARIAGGKQYLSFLATSFDAREEANGMGAGWLWDSAQRNIASVERFMPIGKTAMSLGSDFELIKRQTRRRWYPAQKSVAQWMGDTRLRRIGTYLVDEDLRREIEQKLKPGDIMLSRKNWYLSNVGLPGFWPHAILYIGGPDKLKTFFDTPEVRAWIATLSGKNESLVSYLERHWPRRFARYASGDGGEAFVVIEAVSEGVILNTLSHAAGDYLAALRPRLSKVAKAMAVVEAFEHLGKPYDFDFDFATDHALVCTELVWRSYRPAHEKPGIEFILTEMMGRKTMPANEIAALFAAERGQPEPQLDFVYFLDANEKDRRAFASTEEAFAESHRRTKWDVALP